ncbi:hypothetical protein TNCV_1282771 [Trichonephila clavipes]|uniref:Uncharacterized protein n=1 Tax=Trichonephila clavipes TaxID=2585209 RepID=A0A8X6SKZ4_TRICX|nr:hypothetical protein TNCV_1282771 [Trichonephila clavipes]
MLREKSDVRCKDLVPVPLTCQSTSNKHMKVHMPTYHDSYPVHQTTLIIMALFDNVRGLPENMSPFAFQT